MAQTKKERSNFSITIVLVIIIASIAAFGVIAYQQFTTTYAYVAAVEIPAGTKITSQMIDKKNIQRVSVSKQFEGTNIIQDSKLMVGRFTQDTIKPGKMIFSYDLAPSYDLRVNPILQENGYEAFTVKKSHFAAGGTTNLLEEEDRINIYTVTTFDLSDIKSVKQNSAITGSGSYISGGGLGVMGAEDETSMTGPSYSPTSELMKNLGVAVNELPDNIKKICLDSGLDEDHIFYEDTITIARLTWQNVPIVNLVKSTGATAAEASISEITLGVDNQTAEEMYVAMQTSQLGFTVLPYIDGEYTVIDNTGTTNINIYEYSKAFN